MLRRARNVIRATPLAAWTADGAAASGSLQLRIEGADPRLLLVPRLWVERKGVADGKPTGITWSLYSAGEDSQGGAIALRRVDGATARPLGPTTAPGSDGVASVGDNLEISAATPLILAVVCAAPASAGDLNGQVLWFALDAFPADISLSPADYDGLLGEVKPQIAPCVRLIG